MQLPEKNQAYVDHATTLPQDCPGGVVRRILAYTDSCMCAENVFEKGDEGLLHSHPHTQITYIVRGEFDFVIEGQHYIVHAGDTLLKTPNQVHGCVCLEDGAMIDFFTPMREDFV